MRVMKRLTMLVLLVLLVGLAAWPVIAQSPAAQAPAASVQPPADPVATALKNGFDGISRNVSESAAKMPEENFAFKPTPEVRSFGEILGHVANSHYSYCSRVKGEKNPNAQDLEKVTAKADLVKAVNDSIDYCKAVYASMTDAKLAQPVAPPTPAAAAPAAQRGQAPAAGQAPAPRPAVPLNVLLQNVTHDWEHYGNLVTYLRLKGLVPPSTERSQMGRGRGGL
jgi:uncharacterized damage-inducible protein DinB